MKRAVASVFAILVLLVVGDEAAVIRVNAQSVSTNKDKVLTIAVQGQVAPAQPARAYAVTWDGKPKMMIGTGGINYNLKIGDKLFGWAAADRATVGVATEGVGEDRFKEAWLTYTSIGNEVKVLGGDARGEKGIIVGKFGAYVLVHFEDTVLARLAIGDALQVKASGVGLEIDGFSDVFVHGVAPQLLEKLGLRTVSGRLEVPVVKEIPAEIVGQGAGGSSLSGNWHIQTTFPPDIKEHRLDDLRFGDLVLLRDIETDYGKGYYKGGATIGVVCSGPSDISGLGIGVTPILSTRFGKLVGRIDPTANIGKYLGITMQATASTTAPGTLRTNKDSLIATAVQGVVQPAGSRGYGTTYDGKPVFDIGMASINYTVTLGDPAYGWASGDHVEPDVTIQGRDRPAPSECALAILACIGNEVRRSRVVSEGDCRQTRRERQDPDQSARRRPEDRGFRRRAHQQALARAAAEDERRDRRRAARGPGRDGSPGTHHGLGNGWLVPRDRRLRHPDDGSAGRGAVRLEEAQAGGSCGDQGSLRLLRAWTIPRRRHDRRGDPWLFEHGRARAGPRPDAQCPSGADEDADRPRRQHGVLPRHPAEAPRMSAGR